MWGVDVFNYGHVVPKLTFKSDEDVNDFVGLTNLTHLVLWERIPKNL